jgi:hypothetical protein
LGVVADLYANFYANIAPLQNSLRAASADIKKFVGSSGLGGLAMGLMGTEAGIRLLERGFNATIGTVKKVMSETAIYSDQIRELTRNTGMSVQESAKMLQVADDSQVSFSSLTTAMKYAIKDGVLPNIAGIAKLSDEYLALQDPLQRSQMLINQFGRNGLEMSKIMELGSVAINKTANNAEKFGMIMSNQDIIQMRKYEMALNDLQTSFKGLGIQLALSFAQPLASAANGIVGFLAGSRAAITLQDQFAGAVEHGNIGLLYFSSLMARVTIGELDAVTAERMLADAVTATGGAVGKASANWNQLNAAIRGEPTGPTGTLGGVDLGIGKDLLTAREQLKYQALGGDVLGAIRDGIVANAGKGGVIPESVANQMIQEAYTIEQAMQVSMGNIDFSQAGKNISDAFGIPLDAAITKAKNVGSSVSALNGLKSYLDVYIRIHVSGGGWNGAGLSAATIAAAGFANRGDYLANAADMGNAKGANFIVPPGYPNDSYPMLVESGEKVIVIPRNKVNQIPKMRYGTGDTAGYRDPNGGGGDPFWGFGASILGQGKEYQASYPKISSKAGGERLDVLGNIPGGRAGFMADISKMLKDSQSSSQMQKSVQTTITPMMSGLITAQTAKTTQQISTIAGRQAESAQKNSMMSGEMLALMERMARGIERIPVDVRDAVMLVSG